jgi:hypothetical protein
LIPLLVLPGVPWAQVRDVLQLAVKGDRVTLRAQDVEVAVVLEQLARAAGFTLHFDERVEERISADLADVRLDEGIQRLLKHWNTLVLYDENRGVPSAVYVFGPRGGTMQAALSDAADAPTPEPGPDGEVDIDAHTLRQTLKVEAVERELEAASSLGSPAALARRRLGDPDASVRATALHWLVARPETVIDALVAGLADRDHLVQIVATEVLLDRGLDEGAVDEIKSAAQAADLTAARQMLAALYAR